MIYLPDSDTLNYVIKGIQPAKDRILAATRGGAEFALSLVVHYEVTRYHLLRRTTRLSRLYQQLTADWQRVELTGSDWDKATDLWVMRHRAGRPIEDADLLIAVTALKAGAVLVTNNTRHYEGLGLAMENRMLP
jgi:predicted nucleic acid-binding protein